LLEDYTYIYINRTTFGTGKGECDTGISGADKLAFNCRQNFIGNHERLGNTKKTFRLLLCLYYFSLTLASRSPCKLA
jgi:hypothetical protein